MFADRNLPLVEVPSLRLRPMGATDAALVFSLRNHPSFVATSSSQQEVEWQEHLAWFSQSLSGEQRMVMVIESSGRTAGQLRFEWNTADQVTISIFILPQFTGKGLGPRAIRAGCQRLCERHQVCKVVAWVRRENFRSASAFLKAGFVPVAGNSERPGHDCLQMLFSAVGQ